jgi:glycosyltransferase involved in cell wall biosynthesis
MLSIIVTTYDGDFKFLPHCINGLMHQECKEFEVLVIGKNLTLAQVANVAKPVCKKEQIIVTPNTDYWGNPERYIGLNKAKGRYITWLSADNLVYPNYVKNHLTNFNGLDCISIINTDHWKDGYWGVLPTRLQLGSMDMLNFALPTKLAKEIDAFGPHMYHEYTMDWPVFRKASKLAPVHWDKTQPVCAAHF